VEQVEKRLHSERTCAFATESGIESPTAGLDEDILYPVVAVPVAVAAVAEWVLTGPKAKCMVGWQCSLVPGSRDFSS
jgi:hypothetical protein